VPSGPPIPGFGVPYSPNVPNISPFPDGFPEDLLDILNKLQFIIPPGTLKPALNPNFGKDVFDGIMKLLDQFMPFLMLYKFFLPALNLIICIIEVLCSIPNPFKMVRAMTRLFRNCLPQFLALFPVFAIIVMIISILMLLIALVEYIIEQVAILVKAMLRNILALNKAIQIANQDSVLAIAKKLGAMLCMFQNLFVIFSFFNILIEAIRDILKLNFPIPPCDSSDPSNVDGCSTSDVCPEIVKQPYTRVTGTLQYYNAVQQSPAFSSFFTITVRNESWQIFDTSQNIAQRFINIVDGYDITTYPKPVFFPTDSAYNSSTPTKQAPYLVDIRVLYNPSQWNGRLGPTRWIRFNNCIVTHAPNAYYSGYDNSAVSMPNGSLNLVGGFGFEDDGVTPLLGFAADGITQIGTQARIENFLHFPTYVDNSPTLHPTDGYAFVNDVEYTFKPSIEVLINKNLVTLGCHPDLALNRTFINQMFAGDAALKLQELLHFMNSDAFPNPTQALECLNTAMTAIRNDLTVSGLATFQATINACLNKLKDDASNSLLSLIGIGFDACNSTFSGNPSIQFTSLPIKISVDIRDRNQINLTRNLPSSVAANLANRIVGYPTFGTLSKFSYDGYQFFTADLTSDKAGSGQLMISFDNNIFCTNTLPTDITTPPTHTLQTFDYKFIYTLDGINVVNRAIGDESDGQAPRRDASDLADAGGSE
jgi:hypothetical protein